MNILFYYRYNRVGGVQTVSHFLANAFQKLGHRCIVFYWEGESAQTLQQLDTEVSLIVANTTNNSDIKDNLVRVIENHLPDVIINQGGHDCASTKLLLGAIGKKIPIISVYHNMPGFGLNIYKQKPGLIGYLHRIKHYIDVFRTRRSMSYIYNNSKYFCLLSEAFIPLYKSYAQLDSYDKVRVIPNPITMSVPEQEALLYKEKEVIYVGRLNVVKRVDRILKIWSNLEKLYRDWKLTIIGDGEEKVYLKTLVKELHLTRVSFEGIQDPKDYYKRASILMLTSDIEGFPLVLLEAMAHQVIPIVYASYPAVYDIIDNQKNGIILGGGTESKLIAEGTDALQMLFSDSLKVRQLGLCAQEKSTMFQSNNITSLWMQLLSQI